MCVCVRHAVLLVRRIVHGVRGDVVEVCVRRAVLLVRHFARAVLVHVVEVRVRRAVLLVRRDVVCAIRSDIEEYVLRV